MSETVKYLYKYSRVGPYIIDWGKPQCEYSDEHENFYQIHIDEVVNLAKNFFGMGNNNPLILLYKKAHGNNFSINTSEALSALDEAKNQGFVLNKITGQNEIPSEAMLIKKFKDYGPLAIIGLESIDIILGVDTEKFYCVSCSSATKRIEFDKPTYYFGFSYEKLGYNDIVTKFQAALKHSMGFWKEAGFSIINAVKELPRPPLIIYRSPKPHPIRKLEFDRLPKAWHLLVKQLLTPIAEHQEALLWRKSKGFKNLYFDLKKSPKTRQVETLLRDTAYLESQVVNSYEHEINNRFSTFLRYDFHQFDEDYNKLEEKRQAYLKELDTWQKRHSGKVKFADIKITYAKSIHLLKHYYYDLLFARFDEAKQKKQLLGTTLEQYVTFALTGGLADIPGSTNFDSAITNLIRASMTYADTVFSNAGPHMDSEIFQARHILNSQIREFHKQIRQYEHKHYVMYAKKEAERRKKEFVDTYNKHFHNNNGYIQEKVNQLQTYKTNLATYRRCNVNTETYKHNEQQLIQQTLSHIYKHNPVLAHDKTSPLYRSPRNLDELARGIDRSIEFLQGFQPQQVQQPEKHLIHIPVTQDVFQAQGILFHALYDMFSALIDLNVPQTQKSQQLIDRATRNYNQYKTNLVTDGPTYELVGNSHIRQH